MTFSSGLLSLSPSFLWPLTQEKIYCILSSLWPVDLSTSVNLRLLSPGRLRRTLESEHLDIRGRCFLSSLDPVSIRILSLTDGHPGQCGLQHWVPSQRFLHVEVLFLFLFPSSSCYHSQNQMNQMCVCVCVCVCVV